MTFWSLAGILAQPIPRPFRYLLLASILVPTAILILAAALDRDHRIEAAKEEASKTVAVLHEHTVKVMDTQELALAQIDDRSRGMAWDQIAADQNLFQDLRRLVERLPQVDGAFLIRPDGEVGLTSRVFPAPPINFADRDYFQAQADTDAGFFVGGSYIGKISRHALFNVSQRRRGGQPGFDGVVGISLSVDYFSRFYQSVAEYDGAAIALARTDGQILVRYPTWRNRSGSAG
jgi:two-component system, NtrC family, sensor kinase